MGVIHNFTSLSLVIRSINDFSKHIHFYCFDDSYNFTHGPDPVIRDSCGLTPEGTDVRDEPQ